MCYISIQYNLQIVAYLTHMLLIMTQTGVGCQHEYILSIYIMENNTKVYIKSNNYTCFKYVFFSDKWQGMLDVNWVRCVNFKNNCISCIVKTPNTILQYHISASRVLYVIVSILHAIPNTIYVMISVL